MCHSILGFSQLLRSLEGKYSKSKSGQRKRPSAVFPRHFFQMLSPYESNKPDTGMGVFILGDVYDLYHFVNMCHNLWSTLYSVSILENPAEAVWPPKNGLFCVFCNISGIIDYGIANLIPLPARL